MKAITRIDYAHLRNEAHVELHETADTIIVRHNPAAPGIPAQYGHHTLNSKIIIK
jgi:hypothetical protein